MTRTGSINAVQPFADKVKHILKGSHINMIDWT